MKAKLILSLLIGAVMSLSVNAQSVTVSGATFPTKMKAGNDVLEYNGAGLRTKYFFKLYVAALYVPTKTTNAQTIIDKNENSAVRIAITSNKVTRERFVETVRDGFGTSTEGRATKAEIDGLMRLFDKVDFKAGQEVTLLYRPTTGVEVYMNKTHLGTVKGHEFKKALWGIWLGKKPADESVKKGMLGL